MNRRSKQSAKRPDANALRQWIGNQQMTTALGVVRKFPGESSHFEIDTENGTNDVLVDVELIPSGTRTAARLGFGNDGVYRIPREGTEVAVLIPYDPSSLIKDSLDYGAIIVGVLDSNAPSQLNDDDIVVIEATRVHVLSDTIKLGDTANDPVARKSDLDAVITTLNTHTHVYSAGPTAGAVTATPLPQQVPVTYSPNVKTK